MPRSIFSRVAEGYLSRGALPAPRGMPSRERRLPAAPHPRVQRVALIRAQTTKPKAIVKPAKTGRRGRANPALPYKSDGIGVSAKPLIAASQQASLPDATPDKNAAKLSPEFATDRAARRRLGDRGLKNGLNCLD